MSTVRALRCKYFKHLIVSLHTVRCLLLAYRTIEDAESRVMQYYEQHLGGKSAVAVYRQQAEASLTDQLDKTKRRIFGFAKTLVVKLAETGYSPDDKKVEEAEQAWLWHLKSAEVVGIGSCDVSRLTFDIFELHKEPSTTFMSIALRACEATLLVMHQSGTVQAEEMVRSPIFLSHTSKLVYSVLSRLRTDFAADDLRHCPIFTVLLEITVEITRCIFEMGFCAVGLVTWEYPEVLCTPSNFGLVIEFWMQEAFRCRADAHSVHKDPSRPHTSLLPICSHGKAFLTRICSSKAY